MPIVQRERIGFNGRIVERVVRCNAQGEFTAELPPEVVEALGAKKATGKTLAACQAAWSDAISQFDKSNTTVRKIIIYKVEYTAYVVRGGREDGQMGIDDEQDDDGESRVLLNAKNMHFAAGTALSLAAGVYEEHCTRLTKGNNYRYKRLKSRIPAGCYDAHGNTGLYKVKNQIDWSEEAEQFFADLGRAFENLIVHLDDWFKTRESVQRAIASRRLILPATQALPPPEVEKVKAKRRPRTA